MRVLKTDEMAVPAKLWEGPGVVFEEGAMKQVTNVASLPFIHKWVALMPDGHWGRGATVGSVIPTHKAIIPAAVGVDLGCGVVALKTSLRAENIKAHEREKIYDQIHKRVPNGRTNNGGPNDRGAWHDVPEAVANVWKADFEAEYSRLCEKHPKIFHRQNVKHLGTLGTGNHFLEVSEDQDGHVWLMLHSGSRGIGNRIGMYFIERAREEMEKYFIHLPDRDLAYLVEGSPLFQDYVDAVHWAQEFARVNRELMMGGVIQAVRHVVGRFDHSMQENKGLPIVNCHHNYVEKENHYGENVWVTRKGAVRARVGDWGIIPGSMGAKSYIVEGKGNPESFSSCSHGAGRAMSRTEAKRRFTLKDHRQATVGVVCSKDKDVLDETPGAYKDIDAVMAAQADLVDVRYTLKQFVCVKGPGEED